MALTQASEGGLKISNAGTNGQFLQKQSGNTGGLTWADASSVGGATGADFNDNVKIRFGTGNDLELYHDGTNNYLKGVTASQHVIIEANTSEIQLRPVSGETGIKVIHNGAVELYHNNIKKLETTSDGINVDGFVYATRLDLDDNEKILVGTGDDLQIYHNGSNTYLDNNTGTLILTSAGNVELSAADDWTVYGIANGAVNLYYDGSKKLETTSSGVAITGNGTFDAAGSNYIRIGSTDAGGATLTLDGDSNGDGSGADYCMITHDTDGHLKIYADNPANAANIQFYSNSSTERMRIDSAGRVGIGTTATNKNDHSFLNVHRSTSDSNYMYFTNSTTGETGSDGFTIGLDGDEHALIWNRENTNMRFGTNGTERMNIRSNGKIAHHNDNTVEGGFGYHGWSGQTQILDSQGLAVFRTTDAWGGSIQLASSRGSYASPSASVAGDRIGGIYFCAHDGTDLNSYTSTIESYVTGTVASNATPGYLTFSTANAGTNQVTERLRVQSGGGISFNGDSAAANALDDYEEGAWTPTLTQTAGVSITTYQALYTKIGRMVHAYAYIYWSGTPSSPGTNFRIGGLPFTAKSGNTYGNNTILYMDTFDFTGMTPLVMQGDTYIYFHVNGGSASQANNGHMQPNSSTRYMLFGVSYMT